MFDTTTALDDDDDDDDDDDVDANNHDEDYETMTMVLSFLLACITHSESFNKGFQKTSYVSSISLLSKNFKHIHIILDIIKVD